MNEKAKLKRLLREARGYLLDYLTLRASRSETDLRIKALVQEIEKVA